MTCRILSQKNFDKRLVTKMLKKKKVGALSINHEWLVGIIQVHLNSLGVDDYLQRVLVEKEIQKHFHFLFIFNVYHLNITGYVDIVRV